MRTLFLEKNVWTKLWHIEINHQSFNMLTDLFLFSLSGSVNRTTMLRILTIIDALRKQDDIV